MRAAAALYHRSPAEFWQWVCAPPSDERELGERSVEFLQEKPVADSEAWDALSPAGRTRAWWVSGLSEKRVAEVASHLIDVAAAGGSESSFIDRLLNAGIAVPQGADVGPNQIPAWHARLVNRNNRWAALNAASFQEAWEIRDLRPYGEWLVNDPCEICAPLDGHVAPLDGEFFSAFWPQLHHGCQCEVATLSLDDVEREGVVVNPGSYPTPDNPDPDFLFDPRDAFLSEPATEAGRADRQILAGLPSIASLL